MTDANPTIDCKHTALLVMDYQPAILARLDDADALRERARQAIAAVRDAGGHVGFVRVAFADADYEAVPAHSAMAAAVERLGEDFHADAPGTQVDAGVAPEPGDVVVRKTRVGAFSTTDLDQQMQALGVTTLVLAGISTSGVVLSTVRDAADRDYRVLVLADACADPDPETHAFLTEKIFPRQAAVIEVGQLADHLGN